MSKYLAIMSFTAAVLLAWVLVVGTFDIFHMNKKNEEGQPGEQKSEATAPAAATEASEIGGDFTLTGTAGTPVSSESSRGKFELVYFGFSSCPDVCPVDLAKISKALENLGDKAVNIVPYFITVDPERDTPEKLKAFSANFHPSIVYLTGSEQQIVEVAKKFKAYREVSKENHGMEAAGQGEQGSHEGHDAAKPEEAKAPAVTVNHSAFIYLMGKDGKYITHFTPTDDAAKITARLQEELSK